jgi:hypothetical protein
MQQGNKLPVESKYKPARFFSKMRKRFKKSQAEGAPSSALFPEIFLQYAFQPNFEFI